MYNSTLKLHLQKISTPLVLFLFAILVSCQPGKKDQSSSEGNDLTNQLAEEVDINAIADHLIKVRKEAGVSNVLATKYPNLDIEKAIQIQMVMLTKLEQQGESVVGWKMGGGLKKDFSPGFGFMLASNEFQSDSAVSSALFAEGSPLIEAEVGFILKNDLPGPTVTHEELINAIDGVGGFCELISNRTKGSSDDTKPTFEHVMADGLSHGGFIRAKKIFKLNEVEFENENGSVGIDGEIISEGNSNEIDLIKSVLYLANKLPEYGRYLHAGDIIITGSIVKPPAAKAGDKIEISFSSFEDLSLELE